jgi:PadR family transcriptional regulator, regulatory protein PadR
MSKNRNRLGTLAARIVLTAGGLLAVIAGLATYMTATTHLDLRPIARYVEVSKVEVSMPSPRFPIPQGTLDMLILQILSLGPAHGYAIARRLDQISRAVVQVNQGSLYPALHRLEQKRWLNAEWTSSETGREAKVYSLTRSGRKQLGVEKDSWLRLAAAVRLIFNEGDRT